MSLHHDLGDVGIASALRRDGRVAGALYLVVVLTGMFCLAWVPSQLGTDAAGAAAQAASVRARSPLSRMCRVIVASQAV